MQTMPGNRKRSLTELDLLARRVAELFYEDQLPHSEIEARLASEGFDVRGERDVRFLLSRARDAGRQLVTLKAEPASASAPPIHDGLSAALADEFNIPVVLVAKTGRLACEEGELHGEARQNKADSENDELHRQLGALSARHVLTVLRDGDLVGVGAGRAVAFTIDALPPLVRARRPRDLRVLSLVGAVNVIQTWGGFPENLDADNNAGKLATIFDLERPNVQPVAHLGVLDDSPSDATVAELRRYLQARPEITVVQVLHDLGADPQSLSVADLVAALEGRLMEANDEDRPSLKDLVLARYAPHLADEDGERMQLALFGFGTLGPRHHLLRFDRLVSPAIKPELIALQALAELHPALRHAVVDVCNHFTVVPTLGVPDDGLSKAREVVSRLNRKLLVVRPSVLDRAREKVLIGGGHAKWRALAGILGHPDLVRVRPTTVITDEGAATEILVSRGVVPPRHTPSP
ncbi:MAG TPA: hypothetical protein VNT52_14360 [Acidimicrobiales bacterium]|nr:hypothetical protein [Acidimicrobiales bacterium]